MEDEKIYDEIRVETLEKSKGKYIVQSFYNVTKFEEDKKNKVLKFTAINMGHRATLDIEMENSKVVFRVYATLHKQNIKACMIGHNVECSIKLGAPIIKKPVDKTSTIRVYMDGDKWCAIREKTFVDIVSSPIGFGSCPVKAINHLLSEEKLYSVG